jgi:hypothetical protein
MTNEQKTLYAQISAAERNRAKANRNRETLAAAYIASHPDVTLEIVGAAAVKAAQADRAVDEARAAFHATIKA